MNLSTWLIDDKLNESITIYNSLQIMWVYRSDIGGDFTTLTVQNFSLMSQPAHWVSSEVKNVGSRLWGLDGWLVGRGACSAFQLNHAHHSIRPPGVSLVRKV